MIAPIVISGMVLLVPLLFSKKKTTESETDSSLDELEVLPADGDLAAVADQSPGEIIAAVPGEAVVVVPGEVLPADVEEDDDDSAVVDVLPADGDLAAVADQSGGIVADVPDKGMVVSDGEEIPEDALLLADDLLAAEKLKNWKSHHKLDVKKYQQARQLTADGLFGPKTALVLASEVGVAPIVRFWPSGSWPGSPAVLEYIAALDELGVDSTRETGQGFGEQPIKVFAEV